MTTDRQFRLTVLMAEDISTHKKHGVAVEPVAGGWIWEEGRDSGERGRADMGVDGYAEGGES